MLNIYIIEDRDCLPVLYITSIYILNIYIIYVINVTGEARVFSYKYTHLILSQTY